VDDFLQRGEPCILTGGCPLVSSLLERWDFEYLSRQFGDTQLSVHFVRRGVTSFTRHYGSGLGEGGVQSMSFAGFLRTISGEGLLDGSAAPARHADVSSPGLWRYYLQAPLLWCARCRVLQLARGAGLSSAIGSAAARAVPTPASVLAGVSRRSRCPRAFTLSFAVHAEIRH
jgi:hypothetical protein